MFVQKTSFAVVAVITALMINCVSSKFPDTYGKEQFGQNSRIIQGKYARDGQFPYQVYLIIYGDYNCTDAAPGTIIERQCGGAIIATNWVLTAASCLTVGPFFDTVYFVYLAAGSVYPDKAPQRDMIAASGSTNGVFPHPDFNSTTLENDIALLKTYPFDFSTKLVQPIALVPDGTDKASYLGQIVAVSGYGLTESYGYLSKKLLFTYLKVVNCTDGAPSSVFCVYNEAGSAICDGDAGGPATIQINGTSYLAGILSYTPERCADGPQGITSVSDFLPWIEGTMANNTK